MKLWFSGARSPHGSLSLGGKGEALAELARAGFAVPAFFVIPPDAFRGRNWRGQGAVKSVRAAVATLDSREGARFAVRSSAIDEDGNEHSFAGQLDSFLEVAATDVPAHVLDVVASGLGERAEEYRAERGLGKGSAPAVVVQRMVDAEAAGVAFSVDPVRGRRDHVVVSAVPGLGEALVSGEVDADTFRVDQADVVLERDLAGPESQVAAIADSVVVQVARLARKAAAHFGSPQDIEWAFVAGRIHLLQSRPITSLTDLPDPNAPLVIWDNSNIAESYPGVTTPLTFTFARRAYAEVYRVFCGILGVSAITVKEHNEVFDQMLGLVRGRIYYNLISWYRVLAMLPGFQLNRRFMEQMMGVREEMPAEIVDRVSAEMASGSRLGDAMRLGRTMFGLLGARIRLGHQRQRFDRRVEVALSQKRKPALDQMSYDELVAHYHELENRLLRRWDAPLVNDFFAMIAFGMLRSLCAKWAGDESLANELVADAGDIVSTEPVRRIREMAAEVRGNEAALRELRAESIPTGRFSALYRHYLDKFGDRCLEELKLESPTLRDDNRQLLTSVVAMAETEAFEKQAVSDERPVENVAPKGLKGVLFRWIALEARNRVRDRENLRFERTRVFGRVRAVFREMGRRLCAAGRLEKAEDVFFLEVEELLEAEEGLHDLPGLSQVRRTEFEGFHAEAEPPDRFSTRGGIPIPEIVDPDDLPTGPQLKGIGCHAGVVEGTARVVEDPRNADLQKGEILVARQTDPGWVMLFPRAGAVVVERGSLLSHSSIVARELGIPAVVSVPRLIDRIKTGERLRVDGGSGLIVKLDAQEGAE